MEYDLTTQQAKKKILSFLINPTKSSRLQSQRQRSPKRKQKLIKLYFLPLDKKDSVYWVFIISPHHENETVC